MNCSFSVFVAYGTMIEIAPDEFFPIWLESRSTLPLNLKYRLRLLFSIVAPYSSAILVMKRSIFSNVVGCGFVDCVWVGFRLVGYVCAIFFQNVLQVDEFLVAVPLIEILKGFVRDFLIHIIGFLFLV